MIKITEETKIKDTIPEGYEFEGGFRVPLNENDKSGYNMIYFKKKEVKDFSWYVKTYADSSIVIQSKVCKDTFVFNANNKNYGHIPFEIKIGLLKFICDDINKLQGSRFNYLFYLNNYDVESIKDYKFLEKINSICPKEFINSLFE